MPSSITTICIRDRVTGTRVCGKTAHIDQIATLTLELETTIERARIRPELYAYAIGPHAEVCIER